MSWQQLIASKALVKKARHSHIIKLRTSNILYARDTLPTHQALRFRICRPANRSLAIGGAGTRRKALSKQGVGGACSALAFAGTAQT